MTDTWPIESQVLSCEAISCPFQHNAHIAIYSVIYTCSIIEDTADDTTCCLLNAPFADKGLRKRNEFNAHGHRKHSVRQLIWKVP
jgi:hypothetical protein